MATKHLIFDLYGTLADADKTELICQRWQLLRFGTDKWMVKDEPEESFFGRFCENKKIDKKKLVESFRRMERTTAFFPGIPELLMDLHEQGLSLNLLSNCGRSIQGFLEEEHEVFCHFDTLTFSYEVGHTKPDREAFQAVLDKLRASPEECVMIGDSQMHDIQGAEAIGMHAILFDGRHEDPEDLKERLEKLMEQQ